MGHSENNAAVKDAQTKSGQVEYAHDVDQNTREDYCNSNTAKSACYKIATQRIGKMSISGEMAILCQEIVEV